MKEIQLTQGEVALVDDCDFDYLNQWKWCVKKDRNTCYALRGIKSRGKYTTLYMHRAVAEKLGFKQSVDHINRNGLDNRRSNLRDSSNKQNQENTGLSKVNKPGVTGVYWHKQQQKWAASIGHNGKRIHLGYFDKLEDAIAARKEGERKYFTHASDANQKDRV